MKRYIGWIVIISLILITARSSSVTIDSSELIEIYVLRVTEETGHYVREENPVINSMDIESYNTITHEIILSKGCLDRLNNRVVTSKWDTYEEMLIENLGAYRLGATYPDKYAVYIDGEEIYTGWFEPPVFISYYPPGIVMADSEFGLVLKPNILEPEEDQIFEDERLLRALAANDLIKN